MSKEVKPYSESQEKFGSWLIKNIGKWQVAVYRATGGRVWNKFLGSPVAILTTIGRKSGQIRRTPLLHIIEGETVVIAASKGGMSKPPVWMHNLRANPECEIQVGPNNRNMRAREATPEEEVDLWPKMTAMYKDFDEYRARTEGVRHIPLFILEPRT